MGAKEQALHTGGKRALVTDNVRVASKKELLILEDSNGSDLPIFTIKY